MADPNEAGTPQATPTGSESAGTVGQVAADGSESTGKPVDPALAMAWKAKAEKFNELEARLQAAEARANAAQQQQYSQQQANPLQEMMVELQQQAPYDVNARAALASLTLQATQQAEMETLRAMTRAGVPAARQDIVAGLVRQSGYRMSVEQADQLARGAEVPDLARQLEAERKRVAELQKALDARTVGGGARDNPANTTPAVTSVGDVLEVSPEEYGRLSKADRERARIINR